MDYHVGIKVNIGVLSIKLSFLTIQKQLYRGVFRKSCSESMQQICRRTLMPKCDFNKVALQLY